MAAPVVDPRPTTLTKVSGGALHGIDTFQAGVRQAWTGRKRTRSPVMGDDPRATARGRRSDSWNVSATASTWSCRSSLPVPSPPPELSRCELAGLVIGHEAQGGHTIARHVAQTERQPNPTRRADENPGRVVLRNARAGRESRICRASCQPDGYRPMGRNSCTERQACLRLDQLGPDRSWCHPRHGAISRRCRRCASCCRRRRLPASLLHTDGISHPRGIQ